MYRILGQTVVFYPIILDQSDFYMSHDMLLLLHNIQVGEICMTRGRAP